MVLWKYCQGNGEMKLTCKIWINWSQKWVALKLTGSLLVIRPWAQRSIRHENFRQIRKKKSYRLLIKWFVKSFIIFVLIKRQNSNFRFRSKWVVSLGHLFWIHILIMEIMWVPASPFQSWSWRRPQWPDIYSPSMAITAQLIYQFN